MARKILNNAPTFTNANVALQNNYVKLTFPAATDKSRYDNTKINYVIDYEAQPIYCGGQNTTSYQIEIDDNDSISIRNYISLSVTQESDGLLSAKIYTPDFATDMVMMYTISALDDFEPYSSSTKTILKSSPLLIIANKPATLDIASLEWNADDSIRVLGTIINTGLSIPANYDAINANHWKYWRAGLAAVFSDETNSTTKLKFNYSCNYGSSTSTINENISNLNPFTFTDFDWITNNNIDFVIPARPELNSDNFYFFKFYLTATNIKSTSESVLSSALNPNAQIVSLLSSTPVFQIKKGTVKTNISSKDTATTGGGMFSHGALNKSGINIEHGHSIALYDHHVPVGSSTAANKPSIGFFDTKHKELGAVRLGTDTDLSLYSPNYKLINIFLNPSFGTGNTSNWNTGASVITDNTTPCLWGDSYVLSSSGNYSVRSSISESGGMVSGQYYYYGFWGKASSGTATFSHINDYSIQPGFSHTLTTTWQYFSAIFQSKSSYYPYELMPTLTSGGRIDGLSLINITQLRSEYLTDATLKGIIDECVKKSTRGDYFLNDDGQLGGTWASIPTKYSVQSDFLRNDASERVLTNENNVANGSLGTYGGKNFSSIYAGSFYSTLNENITEMARNALKGTQASSLDLSNSSTSFINKPAIYSGTYSNAPAGTYGAMLSIPTDYNNPTSYTFQLFANESTTPQLFFRGKASSVGSWNEIVSITTGGTNTDRYVRYSNGTLTCTKKLTVTVAVSSTTGSMYYAAQNFVAGNWAYAFYDVPTVSISCSISTSGSSSLNPISAYFTNAHTATTSGMVGLYSATSQTSRSYIIDITAEGRWKA